MAQKEKKIWSDVEKKKKAQGAKREKTARRQEKKTKETETCCTPSRNQRTQIQVQQKAK